MANRKSIINEIETFQRRIREHEAKINRDPSDRTVPHWQKEIDNFEREIAKLKNQLNVELDEAYCASCRRTVQLRGNKCNNCGMAIT